MNEIDLNIIEMLVENTREYGPDSIRARNLLSEVDDIVEDYRELFRRRPDLRDLVQNEQDKMLKEEEEKSMVELDMNTDPDDVLESKLVVTEKTAEKLFRQLLRHFNKEG